MEKSVFRIKFGKLTMVKILGLFVLATLAIAFFATPLVSFAAMPCGCKNGASGGGGGCGCACAGNAAAAQSRRKQQAKANNSVKTISNAAVFNATIVGMTNPPVSNSLLQAPAASASAPAATAGQVAFLVKGTTDAGKVKVGSWILLTVQDGKTPVSVTGTYLGNGVAQISEPSNPANLEQKKFEGQFVKLTFVAQSANVTTTNWIP
jgi:hypothetical protein